MKNLKTIFICLLLILIIPSAYFVYEDCFNRDTLDTNNEGPTVIEYDEYSITLIKDNERNTIIGYSERAILKVKKLNEDEIIFLDCSDDNCTAKSLQISSLIINEIFELNEEFEFFDVPSYLGGQFDWNEEGTAFVIALEDRLVKFDSSGEETLYSWTVLNPEPGIGGRICQEVMFSPDSERILFCNSTASLNSIWGKLLILNSSGEIITDLSVPDFRVSQLPAVWLNSKEVLFLDDLSKNIQVYEPETGSSRILTSFVNELVYISNDLQYLKMEDVSRNSVRFFDIAAEEFTDNIDSNLYFQLDEIREIYNIENGKNFFILNS